MKKSTTRPRLGRARAKRRSAESEDGGERRKQLAPTVVKSLPASCLLPTGINAQLVWTTLPAESHRARYQNELSRRGNCRGALEGRDEGIPTVKIVGLESMTNAPHEVALTVFVATPDGRPHPYFYCKTAGRDAASSCHSFQLPDGTHALRQVARAQNDFTVQLRHVGVVRLRQEQSNHCSRRNTHNELAASQTNYFCLRVVAELANADLTPLAVTSDSIKCISSTQSVLRPKINQIFPIGMTQDTALPQVMVLGKDFARNTLFRIFQQLPDGSTWQETVTDDSCDWVCSHHCCAKLNLPPLPACLLSNTEAVPIFIEGVSHSARKPASTIPVGWEEAVSFNYPPPKKSEDETVKKPKEPKLKNNETILLTEVMSTVANRTSSSSRKRPARDDDGARGQRSSKHDMCSPARKKRRMSLPNSQTRVVPPLPRTMLTPHAQYEPSFHPNMSPINGYPRLPMFVSFPSVFHQRRHMKFAGAAPPPSFRMSALNQSRFPLPVTDPFFDCPRPETPHQESQPMFAEMSTPGCGSEPNSPLTPTSIDPLMPSMENDCDEQLELIMLDTLFDNQNALSLDAVET